MKVRLATPVDVALVADMLDEATAFVATFGFDQWPLPFPRDELLQRVRQRELYVVEVEREPAATFTLLWDDPFFWGERPPDAVYLHKLAVRRAFAGRRLGEQIVEWVDATAAAAGRSFVRLDTQRDDPGIRRYYERLGFELRGDRANGRFAWALYERRVQG
jgi:ribosomal protein S18 acetylase RimI-like enzyme